MSYVMFAAICDHCGKRSEEYSNFPHCRECDAHVCPECSKNEDAESGRADCNRCASEIQDEPIRVRGVLYRDGDDAHDTRAQREIDEASQ